MLNKGAHTTPSKPAPKPYTQQQPNVFRPQYANQAKIQRPQQNVYRPSPQQQRQQPRTQQIPKATFAPVTQSPGLSPSPFSGGGGNRSPSPYASPVQSGSGFGRNVQAFNIQQPHQASPFQQPKPTPPSFAMTQSQPPHLRQYHQHLPRGWELKRSNDGRPYFIDHKLFILFIFF